MLFSSRSAGAVPIALAACLSFPGQAADQEGHFVVKGAGTSACADYVAAHRDKSGDFLLYLGWLGGYLTAVNEYRANTYDIAAWESVGLLAEYLDGHCQRHPQQQLSAAARQLIEGLHPDRRPAKADERIFQTTRAKVRVAPEVVDHVEARLRDIGLLTESSNIADIQEALGAYQRSKGLPETRLPDQRTLHMLLRGSSGPPAGP